MKKNLKDKNLKFWIRLGLGGGLALTLLIFGFINMRAIITGLHINAEISDNNLSEITQITGDARNATFLSLNGREIFIDKEGRFKEDISLPAGYSVITLFAEDKLGETVEKKIEVYKKEKSVVALKTSFIKY